MRIRVDTRFGYVSYDQKDVEKAYELYREQGIRIRFCKDIHDEGEVVDGLPLDVNFERKQQVVN